MSTSLIQRSFAGGEVAPAVYGRADQIKYQVGLRTCRNFFVRRHGGVANRSGSQYIATIKNSAARARLLKFVFNAQNTFLLVFENQCVRFIQNGAQVVVSGVAAYNGATAYNIGDLVSNAGINYYCIAATTGNAPPNASFWYALTGNIYEIPTPYVTADLQTLQATQSGDVVTLTHPSYPVMDLSRFGNTRWTLAAVSFTPGIAAPTGLGLAGGAGVGFDWIYVVTALAAGTLEESLPSSPVTLVNKAVPVVASPNLVTWSAVPGAQQYNIYRQMQLPTGNAGDGIFGLIGSSTTLAFPDNNSVTPDFKNTPPIGRAPFSDLVSQGSWNNAGTTETISASGNFALFSTTNNDGCIASFTVAPDQPVPILFTLSQVQTGAPVYVVEFWDGAAWTAGTISTVPDFTQVSTVGKYTPAGAWNVGGSGTNVPASTFNMRIRATTAPGQAVNGRMQVSGAFPAVAGYFQQRKLYGNTNNNPQGVWASKSGSFKNLTISSPLQDDDAVTFTIAGRQINAVTCLAETSGSFLILTAGGEVLVAGDSAGILTPTAPGLKQQSYNGAAMIPPVIIGDTILYLQARGSFIRDLKYVFTANGYRGNDVTVFAPHLFLGYTIQHMDYAQIPDSIVWCQRSDGLLLGLTYVQEQDVWGWHRHDTINGNYEDVCCIPEGTEDATYVLINRTIQGATVRYIERFSSRFVTDVTVDAHFLDAYLSYDGRNTGATTMTLTGGSGNWDNTQLLTLTASTPQFSAADVTNGNAIVLNIITPTRDATGRLINVVTATVTLNIQNFTNNQVVTGFVNKNVPAALQGVAVTTWSKAVPSVSGLQHLAGQAVGILADGNVINDGVTVPLIVVSTDGNGTVALGRPYSVVHVGLPVTGDFELLDLDVMGGETISDKKKLVTSVTLFVEASRGIYAGIDAGHLQEYKQRSTTDYPSSSIPLVTDKIEVRMGSKWNGNGRVFVRQQAPLPLTILSAIPNGEIGG